MTNQHSTQGRQTLQQNKDGTWSEAKPLPYYPSIFEKILHLFGVHQWTYRKPFKCVMCGARKDL